MYTACARLIDITDGNHILLTARPNYGIVINTIMSDTDIHSTAELASIAIAGEREAIRRYSELAGRMREYGNDEACALFEWMIDEERTQEKQLSEWADLEGLAVDAHIGPIRWNDPGVATLYDAAAVDPNRSTPYKALAFAVHNKERAFRFYAYVAATSKDPDVRASAEMLAQEKLCRTAVLRAHRRRAWHVQRRRYGAEPKISPGVVSSIADLLAASICIEQCLADLIDAAADKHPELQELVTSARELLSTSTQALHDGDAPGAEITAALKSLTSWHTRRMAVPDEGATELQRLCVDCDRSFAFYDSVVASSQDESIMLMAQRLSAHSLQRLSVLRRLIGGSGDQSAYQVPL